MVDPKARAREGIDPIAFEQTADDESEEKLREIARLNRMMVQAERHVEVCQLTTILIRVKRAMQHSSVIPNWVRAPPFCVVRFVRLLVN